jgi:hypothetical protein
MTAPGFPGDPASLYGVSALADDDAWAVGFVGFQMGLILHWDGQSWTQVSGPSDPVLLQDVVAIDQTHAWAVGSGQSAFIDRWAGTSWQPMTVPGVPSWSLLNGVDALGIDDAWAVGSDVVDQNLPLIVHWDGTSWTRVPTQRLAHAVSLEAVAVVGADEAWAVGYGLTADYQKKPLVLRWDGSSWTVTPTPRLPGSTGLEDVSASSAGDVIAVGTIAHRANGSQSRTLVERWDGTSWRVVPSPNPSPKNYDSLHGVSVSATDGIWAVGRTENPNGNALFQELILHWSGTSWAVAQGPAFDFDDDLMGVDVVGSHRFAVGSHTSENGGDFNHVLAEDSCGGMGKRGPGPRTEPGRHVRRDWAV